MKSVLLAALIIVTLTSYSAAFQESFDNSSSENTTDLNKVELESGRIEIWLPESWNNQPEKREDPGVTIYHFRRHPVNDGSKRRIIPNLAVLAEDIEEDIGLVEYSVSKRTQLPYRGLSSMELAWMTPGSPGVLCYLAEYDAPSGMKHKLYIIHSLIKGRGIQIIIDGTKSVFDMLDSEYKIILDRLEIKY